MTEHRKAKIVVIGGGTGLSVLLKGLKRFTSELTAIVTVSDDGGSSGRLRAELGVLPPGDIRNCLVALAETETMMDKVFQHRFEYGDSIQGHNLGNLLLVAMTEITGDFVSAIEEVSKVLAVRGRVLPATLEHVLLGARMKDGKFITGETAIRNYGQEIEKIFLIPEECMPVPASINAIIEADAVILGPGSLYTSIIPNILVKGVQEALAVSPATKIYISNIMTEQGETDNFSANDHLQVIMNYMQKPLLDYIIINNGRIDDEILKRYKEEAAIPVTGDYQQIINMGINVIEDDLLSHSDLAWHDPDKLANTIIKIINNY